MLSGTLGASLIANLLTDKNIIRVGEAIIRVGEKF